MRGWIQEVDAKNEQIVHSADKRDLDALAEHCAALRSVGATGSKDNKLVMHADAFTIQAWCDVRGVSWAKFWNDNELLTRFIDDPDNAAFRVWDGRL